MRTTAITAPITIPAIAPADSFVDEKELGGMVEESLELASGPVVMVEMALDAVPVARMLVLLGSLGVSAAVPADWVPVASPI